jgi:methyl-accepting chemotaxis protein
MFFNKLTLRSKVLIGGLTPLILLLFTGIMSIISIDSMLKTNNRVIFTYEIVQDVNEILTAVVDMETGMRGYLLSGKDQFLEPYRKGNRIAFENLSLVQQTVSHNAAQVKRLQEMKSTLDIWNNNVFEPAVTLRKQIGDTKTLNDLETFVAKANGKKYIDKFRQIMNEFIHEENILMKQRTENRDKNVSRTDQTIIICIIISIILGILLSLFVTNSVINQLGCDPSLLANAAKKIAIGDLSERLNAHNENSVAKNLDHVSDMLENLLNEFNDVVDKIAQGVLTYRGDATKFVGSYQKLIKGANNIADIGIKIVDSAVIPIMIINKKFEIVFMNKEGCQLFGMNQSEVINQKCYDLIKTDDCRTANCACAQAMNTGQKVFHETAIQSCNNRSMEIDYFGMPLKSPDGSIVGAFEYIIDQTDMRRSKNYQESEVNKLSETLNKVAEGDLSLRYTPSGNINVSKEVHNNFTNISNALNAMISKIEKVNNYQTIEVDHLSAMLQKIANGDMNQTYIPTPSDEDTIDVYQNFSNISNAINTTVQKIAKVSSYQEKEVAKLTNMLKIVSKGDTTQQYHVTDSDNDTNEAYTNFKHIADALNSTLADLTQIIRTVKEYAENVADSSNDLSQTSTSLSENVDQVSAKTTSVAAAVEQMSNNISSMASSTEEISVNANEVSSTANKMSENMNSVAAAVEESTMSINEIGKAAREGAKISINATTLANDATNVMNILGEAAKEIGEVTEVIKRIADQTNLLALNATIEAASAGDAGRGFAVVANEIKKLANQSAQAAENISKRIEGVQTNTIDAIESIEQVTEVINQINESVTLISTSVDDQTEATKEISTNVSQVTNGAKQISLFIEEVANGLVDMSKNSSEVAYATNDVSGNVQLVERSVSESNDNIKKVSKSAKNLADIASQLRELVSTFNV